jgi:alkylation response protein AidB-like acyl-CoA dehydrogenase
MDPEQLAALATSARSALAATADPWELAQQQGWTELDGDLGALVALSAETGRAALTLPLADIFVTGDASTVVAATDASPVETWPATHAVILDTSTKHPVLASAEALGMARPCWSTMTLGPGTAVTIDRGPLLLALAARALGAARRSHELAVEHAKARVQFGRAIGSFGAVQQRVATAHIAVVAGDLLIGAAVSDPTELTVALAVEHVLRHAPAIQLAAQHTLAASGYTTEHEAPALFRRVHADVVMLRALQGVASVAELLVDDCQGLPELARSQEAQAFTAEVAAVLDQHPTEDPPDEVLTDDPALVQAFAERSWLDLDRPTDEVAALNETVNHRRAPVRLALGAVALLGEAIKAHGTPEQQAELMPRLHRGEIRFCLGYSEPEAGSDLASLRTRAVADGEHWVIDGQKLWTSGAQHASHVWLAVRTDPTAKKHLGISVFLVPMDTPGITVTEHGALHGATFCTVTYDQVRVPDTARIGALHGGWPVILSALSAERIMMGGVAARLHRQLDDVVASLRLDPSGLGPVGSARRAALARAATAVQATRVMTSAATAGGLIEAPMAGVLGGETAEELGELMLEVLGPCGLLRVGPGGGHVEAGLRIAVMYVVGGGTNDVQRGLIARLLGLPKE